MRIPAIKSTRRPADAEGLTALRARRQPSVPEGYSEVPYIETAPEPVLTAQEKRQGFFLFQRPITEPVYPNTRPLAHERLRYLSAFATPGEFEPVTFSIYPVRDLKDLRVRASSLRCRAGEIPASAVDVRLLTYWNVGYPRYTSRSTYRRTPELLEKVNVHSSPAKECQRYWLKIHVPEDALPGLYRGTVAVWDDGYAEAIEIPLALRVLDFRLKKDPNKRYSVYYYVRNRVQFDGKDEEFVERATANDYRAMVEYGLDMLPTLQLRCEDGKRITVAHADELDRMLRAGMRGPAPVTAGGVIARFYRDTTPGGQRGRHWRISKMPPPEFYAKVTEAFRAFETERKAKGWPEFVCCPIDEVDASCKEFGSLVYAAVKAAGIRTYATKNPRAADAAVYAQHLDVWCSQPYSAPYEKIVSQRRYEYWCYPNHNAGEIKDRRVMCKGGRMTYGFGFWRSGYSTLIPWHWSWTPRPDQFDYLRGSRSGCGQRIGDDGEVIPAVYWECFREGCDDGRYIYTLQSAIVEREGSRDRSCRRLVAQGKELLQETWDSINVQQKYLDAGMWPSEEFDVIRWRMADLTERLLRFPAVRKAAAPSVLVADTAPKAHETGSSAVERAIAAGNIEVLDLGGGDFGAWRSGTAEGKTEVTAEAARKGETGLRWTVLVDHKVDGGEGGKYPVGWPRVSRSFKEGELDMSRYDYLSFWVRVDSNRDEVADDYTPLGFLVSSHKKQRGLFEKTVDLGDRQRVWIPVRLAVKDMIKSSGAGLAPWTTVNRVQLYISERNYTHGTKLTFDVGEVSLLRLKSPVIGELEAAKHVCLPRPAFRFSFEVLGMGSVERGSHSIRGVLRDRRGRTLASASQDLTSPPRMVLDTSRLRPGAYRLRVEILDAAGELCSELSRDVRALAGPLHRR